MASGSDSDSSRSVSPAPSLNHGPVPTPGHGLEQGSRYNIAKNITSYFKYSNMHILDQTPLLIINLDVVVVRLIDREVHLHRTGQGHRAQNLIDQDLRPVVADQDLILQRQTDQMDQINLLVHTDLSVLLNRQDLIVHDLRHPHRTDPDQSDPINQTDPGLILLRLINLMVLVDQDPRHLRLEDHGRKVADLDLDQMSPEDPDQVQRAL